MCTASPPVRTVSRWPSVSHHTHMCNHVMILCRAQMCGRHSTLRQYAYHFSMICDRCWKEDRYMHPPIVYRHVKSCHIRPPTSHLHQTDMFRFIVCNIWLQSNSMCHTSQEVESEPEPKDFSPPKPRKPPHKRRRIGATHPCTHRITNAAMVHNTQPHMCVCLTYTVHRRSIAASTSSVCQREVPHRRPSAVCPYT